MTKATDGVHISPFVIKEILPSIKNIRNFQQSLQKNLSENTSQIVDIILGGTIILRASDIHIEPQSGKVRLRIRVDGVLQTIIYFSPETYKGIVDRFKLLSRLKLNIRRKAQDGRFNIIFDREGEEKNIEVRTSALPSEYGEAIVMRILDPKNLKNIEKLGIREDILALFQQELKRPNGMILVTGPTGSGKTTTLYAFLRTVHDPGIKIITIEDPIEYELEGISQTQVNPTYGYDFESGLSAIVRQDPDVILVGEIRTYQTAKIALQAAMTGHLVFSTLHTNDATGTISRLEALGESSTNIAPALNLVIAQRLVRNVCPRCAYFLKATDKEKETLRSGLKGSPVLQKFASLDFDKLKIAHVHPDGCESCNFTGYQGRTGIFEAFALDDEIENFVLESPSIPRLKEALKKKGMTSMYQDGLVKVIQQKTTLEEVLRVSEK
jgi:type II secretory ATPase GspE/PulE/Tfp pilus assembly ATPase PilB-like protein